ncbi:imidazole glycerol phosphate synthase subunit HisH [Janibacter alittae]|uniref:Imidazole glycerol phosphate synthase subunit HisH n=1 Tax=Janibacter alittae TaxID=3115209 RepID=A0ABZ2MDU6_9MICO
MTSPHVVVLDHGSGNVHSVVRALDHVGADVELTADRDRVLSADGLLVPGVGNFHACMGGLEAVDGAALVDLRLAGGRPVLGVCVGMQVMFDGSEEPSGSAPARAGLGQWPGTVTRLRAPVVPHMGWSTTTPAEDSVLFAGVEAERFYFVHSYAVADWDLRVAPGGLAVAAPRVTWSEHGSPFVAAVENGPLSATQFHPEKSGDAGLHLLKNWVMSL